MFLCLLCLMRLGADAKRQVKEADRKAVPPNAPDEGKSELLIFFKDKALVALIAFSLVHSLGNSFFYSYYPIYFVEIGGNSQWVGIMIFACAMSELPFFMSMELGRIYEPVLAVACNLLQGFSFTAVTWCLLNYINENIPYAFRARVQVLNNVIAMIFSKFIFGYLGGALFDSVGTPVVFFGMGVLMAVAAPVFMGYVAKQLKGRIKENGI